MRINSLAGLLILAAATSVIGADATGKAGSADSHHYFHKSEKPMPVRWGYKGKIGPRHWGELSPAFSLARSGKQQSPIDLTKAMQVVDQPIAIDYHPSKIDLVYNGHTIEEIAQKKSWLTVGESKYQLLQFHFHSPSEHTVNGKHYPMEMHLVHKSNEGRAAVIGILINEGKPNESFGSVWDYLPSATRTERKSDVVVNTRGLLPKSREHFRYQGSFTTPPCTEDVLWIVMSEPVHLSRQQIAQFRSVIEGNNRPVQPRNGRKLIWSK